MSNLRDYLGMNASALLEAQPYRSWTFERTIEGDLLDCPIYYVCEAEGFSMNCDGDDRINAIFLTSADLAHAELNLPLQCKRRDVLASLGSPTRSGEPSKDNILGEYGAWDRYDEEHYSLHIEYVPHNDRIKMVTLMRPDAVPETIEDE